MVAGAIGLGVAVSTLRFCGAVSLPPKPPPPPETLAGPARFAVQVEARRGGRERVWTARGQDPYALTGDIAAYVAGQLLSADFAGRGVLAPAQALEPEAFLEWLTGRGVALTAG